MEKTHGRELRATLEGLQDSPLCLDFFAEIDTLRRGAAYSEHGRDARTLVKYPGFSVVLTVLRKGIALASHSAAGPVSIQVLDGAMCVRVPGREIDLRAGHGLALEPGAVHDVEAREDCAFLVTLAK